MFRVYIKKDGGALSMVKKCKSEKKLIAIIRELTPICNDESWKWTGDICIFKTREGGEYVITYGD